MCHTLPLIANYSIPMISDRKIIFPFLKIRNWELSIQLKFVITFLDI